MKLLVVTGQEDLNLEFETVQNPKPEILMQSKLQFSKKRVFDYIQTLQQKSLEDRKSIYQMIKQIDSQMDQDQGAIRQVKDKEVRKELME